MSPGDVGAGSDHPFDVGDVNRELAGNPHLFPAAYTPWGPIDFMPPETLFRLGMALRDRGYPSDAVTAILGGNFRRAAGQSWASATRQVGGKGFAACPASRLR